MPSRMITQIQFREGQGGVRDFTWSDLHRSRTVQRARAFLDDKHPLPRPRVRPYRTRTKVLDLCRKKITCYAQRRALILRLYRRLGDQELIPRRRRPTIPKICQELGIKF